MPTRKIQFTVVCAEYKLILKVTGKNISTTAAMENTMPENSQPKLPKIVAFKAIQKSFAVVGISPKLPTQSYPFNGRLLLGFLGFGLFIAALGVYIVNYAETFFEYTQGIYIASAGIFVIFSFITLILQAEKLYKCIKRFDSMLNMCRWNSNF